MKKLHVLAFLIASGIIGCHAQVKPTAHTVTLNWVAPTSTSTWGGCTTAAPCSYIASRITLTAGTATCPASNTATPNYGPLNESSPTTALTYTDSGASGLTVCYIIQTQQGTAISGASNTAGPFIVPGNPIAPTLSGVSN